VQEQEQDNSNACNRTLYFVTPPLPGAIGVSTDEERRVLSRLPILAIFHGISHERGVPPSFTSTHALTHVPLPTLSLLFFCASGFLRQWPSLPTFGIFLTTRVLPVPHVEDADRYVVSRVEVLPGFYGVAQFLGFRDEAALHFDEIVARVSELEERYAVREKHADARHRVEQLLDLARHPTHVCEPTPFPCPRPW
jgi:KUP system potassium uptake protein